jgi:hypothetical protein
MNSPLLIILAILAIATPQLVLAEEDSIHKLRMQNIELLLRSLETQQSPDQRHLRMPGTETPLEDQLVPLLARELLRLNAENQQLKAAILKLDPAADLSVPDPSEDLLLEAKQLITRAEQCVKVQDVDGALKLYSLAEMSLGEIQSTTPGFRQPEVKALKLHLLKRISELSQ